MSEPEARDAWVKLSTLVLNNERRRKVSDALDLSFGRIRALRRIAKRSLTMGELATLLSVDPPNVTMIVYDLEARGLVVRHEHPEERRAKVVAVTDEGAALARRAEEILDEPPPGFAVLSHDELVALDAILAKLQPEAQ